MKKLYSLMFCFVAIMASAQNPAVLTDSNMPFGPVAIKSVIDTLPVVTVPTPGVNATWDYSTLPSQQTLNYGYVIPATSYFPQATYKDTGIAVSFIKNTVFYADYYYEENTAHNAMIGTVIPFQHYYIGNLIVGGTSQDSCVFPTQHYQYNNPGVIINYPATINSGWHSNYKDVVDFQLTFVNFAMIHTPCKRVSHITRSDTVIAWGKVIVPTLSGPSMAYDALMIKRQTVTADSFYLNGSIAPALLLANLELSQGQTTISNSYIFWRPNSAYPIMIFNFGANNFTTQASVVYDGLAQPNGINEMNSIAGVNIFPNPAKDAVSISGAKDCIISIFNITGKLIYSKEKISDMEMLNTTGFDKGVYILRLRNDKGSFVQKLVIQ